LFKHGQKERTAALQLREQQLNQAALQAQHQISFLQHQLSSSQHLFNNLNDGVHVQSGEQKNGDNATKFKQLEQQQLEQQRQHQQQLLLRIQDQLNRLQNQ
jgi:hypothetical protein